MRFTHYITPLLLAASLLGIQGTAMAAPRIVTSIKPLELLVHAIAPENTEVTSLVPAGASPHTYQMRPSQRRALADADRIFWVGPRMETFLERLLSGEDFQQRQVALWNESADEGQDEEAHTAHEHDEMHPADKPQDSHDHGHDHDHGEGEDPHLWLDPEMALAMVREIQAQLAMLPGAQPAELAANVASFEQALRTAEADIRQRLEAVRDISLFTYHDAFRRFADHYGLEIQGVLTLNPEQSPGARHIAELQQKLMASQNVCLLTEPQFNRQWWRSITEGIHLVTSTWDPLASNIDSSPRGYIEFQYAIADAVLACLPEQSQH